MLKNSRFDSGYLTAIYFILIELEENNRILLSIKTVCNAHYKLMCTYVANVIYRTFDIRTAKE